MITEKVYKKFKKEISEIIPKDRIYTDELRRLAWGTDAGFYRMIPSMVIRSATEKEVSEILARANYYELPVTFRAAGTSLSGQAISDSILVIAGKNWEHYTISEDGSVITLQPGIIGQRVNEILKPLGRKFAPDPASVKSAMVGGIVMNNASGMNCGTHANSDRVMISARIVFADGTILNTGDETSRGNFARQKPEFIQEIESLRDQVRNDKELVKRINHKYSIKNVMGLNLLPFIRYNDPFDIITHLMVGSEGTLAFLSEVTMYTGREYPHKASAMLYFDDLKEACRSVVAMKELKNGKGEWIVKGAELLDSKSLASVNDQTGEALTAVLTETFAETKEELDGNIQQISGLLSGFRTFLPVYFTDNESEYSRYWAVRSGIFPSVGGMRKSGTTCLIEDVAFHIKDLPEATVELQSLLARHGYDDACIYGHALEGNYHFIINQSFGTTEEVNRYEALMNDVIALVVDKYDGSLKAEHGTGRNMAPYVKYEWGETAFELMKAVKNLFDPKNILNPGVIFNEDPHCHIKNFKPLPPTNPHVDKCIECGFCEINCLTCGFTLSSRQRIVIQREISRLKESGDSPQRLRTLEKQYKYPGNITCAGDGLCSMSCPMNINTGDLTHDLRQTGIPPGSIRYKAGKFAANHFSGIKKSLRPVLTLANTAHTLLGTKTMTAITKGLHNYLGFPLWTPAMPNSMNSFTPALSKREKTNNDHKIKPVHTPNSLSFSEDRSEAVKVGVETVVYFPSCINQTMGLAKNSPEKVPLINKMVSLIQKAGYEVIFPKDMDKLCCGTIWESKGMMDIADKKSLELETALYLASEQGKFPVLCDQSPCLHRMKHRIKKTPGV